MKLSKNQKDAIIYLRNPGAALRYNQWIKKYMYDDNKRLSYAGGGRLQDLEIIKPTGIVNGFSFWELTELGKTIQL